MINTEEKNISAYPSTKISLVATPLLLGLRLRFKLINKKLFISTNKKYY